MIRNITTRGTKAFFYSAYIFCLFLSPPVKASFFQDSKNDPCTQKKSYLPLLPKPLPSSASPLLSSIFAYEENAKNLSQEAIFTIFQNQLTGLSQKDKEDLDIIFTNYSRKKRNRHRRYAINESCFIKNRVQNNVPFEEERLFQRFSQNPCMENFIAHNFLIFLRHKQLLFTRGKRGHKEFIEPSLYYSNVFKIVKNPLAVAYCNARKKTLPLVFKILGSRWKDLTCPYIDQKESESIKGMGASTKNYVPNTNSLSNNLKQEKPVITANAISSSNQPQLFSYHGGPNVIKLENSSSIQKNQIPLTEVIPLVPNVSLETRTFPDWNNSVGMELLSKPSYSCSGALKPSFFPNPFHVADGQPSFFEKICQDPYVNHPEAFDNLPKLNTQKEPLSGVQPHPSTNDVKPLLKNTLLFQNPDDFWNF